MKRQNLLNLLKNGSKCCWMLFRLDTINLFSLIHLDSVCQIPLAAKAMAEHDLSKSVIIIITIVLVIM